MLEFDSFTVCCAEKELTGLNVNIYMPTAKTDDYHTIKPYLWTESNIGYGLVYIKNDYKFPNDVEEWIVKNYDVLLRHWNCEITDKETLNILLK